MKKTTIGMLIAATLNVYASDYKVIINSNDVIYDVGGFVDRIEDTGWQNIGSEACSFDKVESDIYFGLTYNQTESCDQEQERTVVITREYSNGTELIISDETTTQTINTINNAIITGTHLESNCNNILSFDSTLPSDTYTIQTEQGNYDVYCNMTISNGGWMLVMTDSYGENGWHQFSASPYGFPLLENYRGSIHLKQMNFTEILWYNHPTDEYTRFQQRTNSSLTLENSPQTENDTYVYKAVEGVMKTSNAYYNLIQCHQWGYSYLGDSSIAAPILMLSGSDEFGDDFDGGTHRKSCGSWEGDTGSWYYRFAGGNRGTLYYEGTPWKENGHNPNRPTEKLQSFYIR
jgi:hypothetical protein